MRSSVCCSPRPNRDQNGEMLEKVDIIRSLIRAELLPTNGGCSENILVRSGGPLLNFRQSSANHGPFRQTLLVIGDSRWRSSRKQHINARDK